MVTNIEHRGLTLFWESAKRLMMVSSLAIPYLILIGLAQERDAEVLRAERDAARSVAEIRGACVPTEPGQIASLALEDDGQSVTCAIVDTRGRSRPVNRIEYRL